MNTWTEAIIAEHRLPGLLEKFEALARREEKITGARTLKLEELGGCVLLARKQRIPAVVVRVTGTAPVLPGGWRLVGVVEPAGEGVNLVLSVPGFEGDLAAYRTAALRCDHCETVRDRKQSFIVEADGQGRKMIGRNCLADFLGHRTPEAILAWAAVLGLVRDGLDEGESWDSGSTGNLMSLASYLACVSAVMRVYGWVPKSRDPANATAESAAALYFDLTKGKPWPHVPVEGCDLDRAERAMAWAAGLEARSDFDHNLKAIASMRYFNPRRSGIAAYIVPGYLRALDREAERAQKTRGHFGEVGKRAEFSLKLIGVSYIEGDYGTTAIHRFEDAAGNLAVWFASNGTFACDCPDFEHKVTLIPGVTYTLKATVKAHGDYKGTPQTVLSRVAAPKSGVLCTEREREANAVEQAIGHADQPVSEAERTAEHMLQVMRDTPSQTATLLSTLEAHVPAVFAIVKARLDALAVQS